MVEPAVPESFVARIWLEGVSKGDRIWRGHIQHVQGDEEYYFHNLSELKAFLERVSGVSLPAGNKTGVRELKNG